MKPFAHSNDHQLRSTDLLRYQLYNMHLQSAETQILMFEKGSLSACKFQSFLVTHALKAEQSHETLALEMVPIM